MTNKNATSVSWREMEDMLGNGSNRVHQLRLRQKHGEYRVERLHSDLVCPSYVHGYSLAIEFMRSWFLSKFEKDYFKTVYVNGKHVLDDYKYFNRDIIKREKPMLAIMPTVEFDHDREMLDSYLADPSMFLRRSNYQQSFFKDTERSQYLGVQFRELKMNFGFKIRVSSRAQQLDLWQKMELKLRIGATQKHFITTDFHIPKKIMLSIAEAAGFTVDRETSTIKDILEFLSYINSHSDLPITYKMRAINHQQEFFMRVTGEDMFVHIACSDKISLDDGERDGQLDNNFHLEFSCVMRMPIPHFYVYYNQKDILGKTNIYEDDKASIGLYSFSDFKIPDKNAQGWEQVALISYLCEKGENFIDMTDVFSGNTNLDRVMRHNLKQSISPKSFIDIVVYRNDDRACLIKTNMDYRTKKLILMDDMDEEIVYIVIYADREYINTTMINIEEYNKTRISYKQNN